MHGTWAKFPTLLMATKSCSRETGRKALRKKNDRSIGMIRLYDLDERLADIELIDGKMVFRRVVGKGVIDVIEFQVLRPF